MKTLRSTAHRRAAPSGGFTLLEVLIALVMMGIAGLGAIAGLTAASQNLRNGQLRQVEMALLDAKSARLMLMDKSALIALAKARPVVGKTPDVYAVGDVPWVPDPSVSTDANDISAGAYFSFLPNGQIQPIIQPGQTSGNTMDGKPISAGTPCASPKSSGTVGGTSTPSLPLSRGGPYCREIAVTLGLPPTPGADDMNTQVTNTSATIYTLWIRVSRVGDPDSNAIVQREVFTQ